MMLLTSLALMTIAVEQAPAPVRLSLTSLGRFAILADTASRTVEGRTVRMRALQVSEDDMVVGQKTYVGGWSWWRFDCAAGTADRLDFASLNADLVEGPATPESQPPFAISPGGDAAGLAGAACGEEQAVPDATSIAEAVRLARQRLAD
ncbi:hypothetical protein [Brevundimonas vesicularis]|uniref:hypothetical protein n=1 Tax=Brevundimonas vesicularis TaxID=41276 RepID=UPI0038D471C0